MLKQLYDLDENKAVDLDNLPGKFLKDGAIVLAKPISQICNLSIKYSIFPSDCKIAKLKPLFKKGSKTDPQNYRPISLLPLVSKIIEKVIHDQAQRFLDKNDIIYRYQLGFRKFFSTYSCLSYLNNKIATLIPLIFAPLLFSLPKFSRTHKIRPFAHPFIFAQHLLY